MYYLPPNENNTNQGDINWLLRHCDTVLVGYGLSPSGASKSRGYGPIQALMDDTRKVKSAIQQRRSLSVRWRNQGSQAANPVMCRSALSGFDWERFEDAPTGSCPSTLRKVHCVLGSFGD